jgi:Cu(I)/Ag(I) efflux system membrane fusion protein
LKSIILLFLAFTISGCSKSGIKENQSINKQDTLKNKSTEFSGDLTSIFEKYIKLKNSLVKSDPKEANKAILELAEQIDKFKKNIDPAKYSQLSGEISSLYKTVISSGKSTDLNEQRNNFSEISNILYPVIKNYGLVNKTAYKDFCPMAFNNKGAYWISDEKSINNPYFGDEMLKCGEVKETAAF